MKGPTCIVVSVPIPNLCDDGVYFAKLVFNGEHHLDIHQIKEKVRGLAAKKPEWRSYYEDCLATLAHVKPENAWFSPNTNCIITGVVMGNGKEDYISMERLEIL